MGKHKPSKSYRQIKPTKKKHTPKKRTKEDEFKYWKRMMEDRFY